MYDKPANILEYLFMYSYIISILASIIFSVSSLLSSDFALFNASNIFFNKNITFILGFYIMICSIISWDIWWNVGIFDPYQTICSFDNNYNYNCKKSNTIRINRSSDIISYIIGDIFYYYFNKNVVITRLN